MLKKTCFPISYSDDNGVLPSVAEIGFGILIGREPPTCATVAARVSRILLYINALTIKLRVKLNYSSYINKLYNNNFKNNKILNEKRKCKIR